MLKKKLVKNISILLGALLLAVTICSIYSANSYSLVKAEETTVASVEQPYVIATSPSGKDYIVDAQGNSIVCTSTQILADLHLTADFEDVNGLEKYFKLAAETGFNTVDIPIFWNHVETEKNVYSDAVIGKYLDFAKQYNLKVNLLWYGSLKDGETKGYCLPNYVVESCEKKEGVYTVLKVMDSNSVYGMVSIMKWDDPDLLKRESKAIYKLLEIVASWNSQNEYYNPVVMFQVGQGADRFNKWRIEQYDIQTQIEGETGKMTSDEAAEMINTYIEVMAETVKLSAYRPLVRAEFCEQGAVTNEVRKVKKAGVDLVCPTYLHTVAGCKTGTNNFVTKRDKLGGAMPVMNSENWATNDTHRQMLTTFCAGGIGYNVYALAPAMYYPVHSDGSLYQKYNGTTFTQVGNRVDNIKPVLSMIKKAPNAFTTIASNGIAALGMNTKVGAGGTQKVYLTVDNDKCIYVDYTVPSASALGFVGAELNQFGYYVYMYSTQNATIKLTGCDFVYLQDGVQNADGTFEGESSKTFSFSSSSISLTAGKLYRLKVFNLSQLSNLASGYEKPLTSLRG